MDKERADGRDGRLEQRREIGPCFHAGRAKRLVDCPKSVKDFESESSVSIFVSVALFWMMFLII